MYMHAIEGRSSDETCGDGNSMVHGGRRFGVGYRLTSSEGSGQEQEADRCADETSKMRAEDKVDTKE